MSLINQKSDWQRNLNLGQVAALLIGGSLYMFYDDPNTWTNFISQIILFIVAIVTTLYTMYLVSTYSMQKNEIQGLIDILSIFAGMAILVYLFGPIVVS